MVQDSHSSGDDQSPSGDVVALVGAPVKAGISIADPQEIVEALKRVYDPEIPVDIYELGLIYRAHLDDESGDVEILMTLTSPNCPVADSLPMAVGDAVSFVEGVGVVTVLLTFHPPWGPERMSQDARLALGF